MARRQPTANRSRFGKRATLAVPLLLGVLLTGCASSDTQALLSSASGTGDATGSLTDSKSAGGAAAARDYWASALAKNPRDEKAAIAYARSLKSEGSKDKAMSLLQQAAMYNPDSIAIASEQGRLALDMGQTDFAEKLLTRANDAAHPDWRVLNALGTLEAQRGNKPQSRDYFERASKLAPTEPSVLNNLALSYALDGDPAKAEFLLRRAAAAGGDVAKVRQNLALVLGVQGKYDEAQQLASNDLDKDKTDANRAYLQKMVAATPVVIGKPAKVAKMTAKIPAQAWSADVATAGTMPVLADAGTLPGSSKVTTAKP